MARITSPITAHHSHGGTTTIGMPGWGGMVGGWARRDIAEAGLKQAGLHRKVQLYPELASSYFCTSLCARFANGQNVLFTNNDVQQYTMLGVAALASLLLQICPD